MGYRWCRCGTTASSSILDASNKLGEDSAGLWLFPIPGTTFIRESIPLGLGVPSQILFKGLAPNSVAGVNVGILEQIEKGRKIIEETGLYRKNLYDALDRLVKRGLITYVTENKIKFFQPKNPENLLKYMEEKKEWKNNLTLIGLDLKEGDLMIPDELYIFVI
jgi:hypothetical protein